jgi:hypothetical protein
VIEGGAAFYRFLSYEKAPLVGCGLVHLLADLVDGVVQGARHAGVSVIRPGGICRKPQPVGNP